jgi:ferredoxin
MAKIIQYRNRCIGCAICFEMQPELWRMSKKDGKAILMGATQKKSVFVLPANNNIHERTKEVTRACLVKISKLS